MELNLDFEKVMKNEFNPCKQDEYIPQFEKKLEQFFHVKNAIAVSSGTAAIHLSLAALNIQEGDEVLVPANAVIMSIVPILYQRALPVFVDCQKNKLDFDYEDLKKKLSKKTKAIIPVYLWGCSYQMDQLIQFAKENNLAIIEDACQAHGSRWNNQYLGTFGKLGCFSLKNGKILATGEGGFILTNDDTLAKRCRLLRNHCTNIQDPTQSFSELAWNYRMTEMQALLGIYHIKDLNDKIQKRKKQTKYFYQQLKDIDGIRLYDYEDKEDSNYFSPVFLCKNGIKIARNLNEHGIINSTGTFGLIPANERKVIQDYCKDRIDWERMKTPNSKQFFNDVIALSISESTDQARMDQMIRQIKTMMKEKKE